jgi:hypothetical protein
MEKGILLMAFGNPVYGKYAYNMANSIRHLNKNIPVHLICDHEALSHIDTHAFTSFEIHDFSFDPCINKINLFDKSPFDQTLYLDVDGVCLNDPELILDEISKGHFIYSQVLGSGGFKDSISYNAWASNETIWKHFKLKEDAVFPAVQTSVIYFDKTKEAANFFKKLKENYKKKLDKKEYLALWNREKNHPDELYYSVTMAQLNILPNKAIQPVFFPKDQERDSVILKDFTILSMWGNNIVKPYAKKLYDRIMFNVYRSIGENHLYKADKLYKGK